VIFDLDYRLAKYHGDKTLECPVELIAFNHLGDSRLLVAGGLYDQPAGKWFAVQRAGYIWQILEDVTKRDAAGKGFDWGNNNWGDEKIDLAQRLLSFRSEQPKKR
jgi:hypothetical protein